MHGVFGSNRMLAATGTAVGRDGAEQYDFVDLFVISEHTLLAERRRFWSTPPGVRAPFPTGR